MASNNLKESRPGKGVKPWVRTQRIMLAIAVVVFVAPCVVLVSGKYLSDKNLSGYAEEVRAEGLPASVDELLQWQKNLAEANRGAQPPGEPDGATAAKRYLQAVELIGSADAVPSVDEITVILDRYDQEGTLADEDRQRLRDRVTANAPVVELLRQASSLPPGKFPVDYALGWDMNLPYESGIRRLARLLRAETMAASLDGDVERTFQALVAAMALSRPLRNEPLLSSQVLRVGCNSSAVGALGQALGTLRLNEEQLARLQELFAAEYPVDAFSTALISERAFALVVFQNPALLFGENESVVPEDPEAYDVPMFQKASAPAVFLAERREYFSGMKELIAAIRLPYPESRPVFEEVAGQPRLRFRPRSNSGSGPDRAVNRHRHPPRGGLRGMFLSYSRLPQIMARDQARLNLGTSALAVERYRLAKGTAPERMDALVPEYLAAPPVDPFDMQPLRYQQDDKGYVIYSVSVNAVDEGGKAGEFADQGDLPFRVQYKQ